MPGPLQVFISSRQRELGEERRILRKRLENCPLFRVWAFELVPPGRPPFDDHYLENVDQCDILLLLLWNTFSEHVEAEWRRASECEKPRLVFVKQPCSSEVEQVLLKERIGPGRFNSTSELCELVFGALVELLADTFRKYPPRERASNENGKLEQLKELHHRLHLAIGGLDAALADVAEGDHKLIRRWREVEIHFQYLDDLAKRPGLPIKIDYWMDDLGDGRRRVADALRARHPDAEENMREFRMDCWRCLREADRRIRDVAAALRVELGAP